ncbi:DUF1612 domain-containing protein [Mesorhizobium sp.]|uniref:DUF1612 domain-containing protein n=1 Tax=Mesorhizobium sp. TaxID=1871066 RepID=UPI000FE7B7B6|nr:DUF1612 domain-containing protein [Mesorhizobium sp.]RWA75909.1 MAG: DUF1612 domain-containing protein [Mesorhizobium sp.]TIL34530.1 MAG: DUF1612 domain-containing protein [Mesorhizobium sp.]TIM47344.1 MAG: DUF1612 domain-containing protein [Mesorhizobium sp.]TIS80298.1 MAG: DUF1612 domain-containing protein [Mesorhizobium sp.]
MPAILAAAIAWDAWQHIEPLQHQHWLGPLLVAALLRQRGKVGSHLFCLNAGLRIVPRDRRRAREKTIRLLAVLDAFAEAAAGLKELDRLALAKVQMERRLRNRRKNSTHVYSVPTGKAEVVEASVILGGPNEHPQECAFDGRRREEMARDVIEGRCSKCCGDITG